MTSTITRLRIALGLVGSVAVAGVIGYRVTGLDWMRAIYMTVITVTTVGYREVGGQPSIGEQIFTIVIITTGVSTVLYTSHGCSNSGRGPVARVCGKAKNEQSD